MENENFIEFLRHDFTGQEKETLAQKLAQAVSDRNLAESEMKQIMAQYKSQIAKSEATIDESAEKLRAGYEMRKIDCERIFDHENQEVREIRLDTLQHINSRPMTIEEKQRLI